MFNLHLINAKRNILSGNIFAAELDLREAIKAANAAGNKRVAAYAMTALKAVRKIEA